jgi:hypothetical protein
MASLATDLSGPHDPPTRRRRRARALARSWLVLVGIAMSSPACLVTSTPEYVEPERTPPFLIPSSADPDSRNVLFIEAADVPLKLSAQVISEDAGQRVLVSLLVDYGVPFADRPFRDSEPHNQPVDPGTMADGPRRVTASLIPQQRTPAPDGTPEGDCHTITMMVSHEFDPLSGCPCEKADSSQLSWFVFRCFGANCSNASEPGVPREVDIKALCPIADPAVTCPDTSDACAGGAL